jgi:hypothetical protein
VIKLGRKREKELSNNERFEDQQTTDSATSDCMRWDAVKMLD